MLPIQNATSTVLLIIASYIFWESSVPPTPPATKKETKKQLPWARIHAITNTVLVVFFMLLSAYRLLIGESANRVVESICSSDALKASLQLSNGALAGLLLLVLGGIIRITSQRTLGRYFTWEISLKPDHKLCTIGPYSFVRHPGYLGLWIVRIAIDIFQTSRGTVLAECFRPRYPVLVDLLIWENYAFTLVLFVWMSFRAKWEDKLMEKEFSVAWRKWAEKTPYRIVPHIY